MRPRKEVKQGPKAVEVRKGEPKPKLRIVKLEERIAPRIALNHNETQVCEPAVDPQHAPARREKETKRKLEIVKLEERIAPGIWQNHNETLVREPAEAREQEVREKAPGQKLQIVKLEERIAPARGGGGCDDFGCGTNHNETLVRDW